MTINEFDNPTEVIPVIAADTETHTYIDGVRVSSDELRKMGETLGEAFFREHGYVHCYAYLVSDGRRFACFETFDEFTDFCAMHMVAVVWWYNAKFDFAILDWQLLSKGWTLHPEKKGVDCSYSSLHGDTGARYSLTLRKARKIRKNKSVVHATKHLDFCNLFGGGLGSCLKAFDVRDFDGNPIRKRSMDYQGDVDENAVEYMRVDVIGLYHLVRIAGEWLRDNLGINILGKKPEAMTAGGIAKKLMLRQIYQCTDDRYNARKFRVCHRVTPEIDAEMRKHWLYRGGVVVLNPRYANVYGDKTLYKYDANSMYPARMIDMPDIYGLPIRVSKTLFDRMTHAERDGFVIIYQITRCSGALRENMVPVWYNPVSRKYDARVAYNMLGYAYYMFKEEFDELTHWYDLDAEINTVLLFRKREFTGMREFITHVYGLKTDGKRERNPIKTMFGKLLCNSSYGKFAQNPHTITTERRLDESGACRLFETGEEISEDCIMSVILGAWVTMSARVNLLSTIRKTCPNVARDFVYCDTDSIATLVPMDDTDDIKLGAYKCEGVFSRWKYIAPKAYFVARENEDGIDGWEIEIHSKGVNIESIREELKKANAQNPDALDKIFVIGRKFASLKGLNIKGGKALIPLPKYLVK